METENTFYVEPPTIPAGMTCREYRRRRSGSRSKRLHRRVTARLRRALRA